jgi:hypothetical protein
MAAWLRRSGATRCPRRDTTLQLGAHGAESASARSTPDLADRLVIGSGSRRGTGGRRRLPG